ncbi:disulfide-isomerase-like protein [Drosera capensis]
MASISFLLVLLAFLLAVSIPGISVADGDEVEEAVLELDKSNFNKTVSNHDFIVVEFYSPGCGQCKLFASEYEKAASILTTDDPPAVLAKVDATENRKLASKYKVMSYPTLKILRNGGKIVHSYKGPRDADGIVAYLRRQRGPASIEIKSVENVSAVIGENNIAIVGIFSDFAGEEYMTFTILAETLRSEFDFGHTLDAKLLPRGESSVQKPIVRIFKPFDELFVDFQDFHLDALEKFVEEASRPIVSSLDPSSSNDFLRFAQSEEIKVMLFFNSDHKITTAYKERFYEIAKQQRGKGFIFLMGDIDATNGRLESFGIVKKNAPIVVIEDTERKKYIRSNLEEPEDIVEWIEEFKEGYLEPYEKSDSKEHPPAKDEL